MKITKNYKNCQNGKSFPNLGTLLETFLNHKDVKISTKKGQCLYVLYRNPNCWTDWDEIWHRGGPQGQEGSWGGG